MTKTELDILVEDAVWHRLTIAESLDYIKTRSGEVISESTFKRKKSYLLSHKGLNIYFDTHMRLGFLQDYRTRKEELERIQDEMVRRWKHLVGKKDVDLKIMIQLAEAINGINKSLREISLDNPVIAGIKKKVEEHDSTLTSSQASSIDYTKGTAFS
jgi:hypothetical protein